MENNIPVTEAELAEWQALCDAATPEPWEGSFLAGTNATWADHRFANGSRTIMPRLIAEVRRLNDKLSLYVIENEELEGEKQDAEEWVQDIFTALKKNFPPCDVDPTEEGIYAKQVVDYIRDLVSENERLKGGTA